MNYDLKWIVQARRNYTKATGLVPYSPSDWNNEADFLTYPNSVISNSLNESRNSAHEYSFMYDVIEAKEIVFDLLNYEQGSQGSRMLENIVLVPNSTSAIFLALKAMQIQGAKRVLVLTPTYFSIVDSLKELNAEIVYFHLTDENNFSINEQELVDTINDQFIDLVVLTDPTFCTGIPFPAETLQLLSKLPRKPWIFVDRTLGNMEWKKESNINVIGHKIYEMDYERLIVIESITKRLFLNGMKIATCFGDPSITSKIEELSNFINGGFSNTQIELAKEIYSLKNHNLIKDVIRKNLSKISENYDCLKSVLRGTPFSIYRSRSGIYTMVFSQNYMIKEIDHMKKVRFYLKEKNNFILPSCRFLLHQNNKAGFRVNLSKERHALVRNIVTCSDVDFKLFQRIGDAA